VVAGIETGAPPAGDFPSVSGLCGSFEIGSLGAGGIGETEGRTSLLENGNGGGLLLVDEPPFNAGGRGGGDALGSWASPLGICTCPGRGKGGFGPSLIDIIMCGKVLIWLS